MGLIAEGLSNKEIAARLDIATHTVASPSGTSANLNVKSHVRKRKHRGEVGAAHAVADRPPTPTGMMSRNPESAMLPERVSQHDAAARSIPVLVVEDNRLLRDGIASILDQHADLEVVVAEGGGAALRHLTMDVRPPPGVVVVDASLADHDPPTLVRRIRQAAPEARVVVMDLVPGPEDIVEFVKAGASGFIMKDATVEVLVETIRSVAAGREVLPPALTATLLSQIAQHAARRLTRKTRGLVRMTPREREIIGLIAEGLSNKEIAQRIHLSPHTVKSHVHNILEKLALHSRLQVAAYVHKAEGEPDSP